MWIQLLLLGLAQLPPLSVRIAPGVVCPSEKQLLLALRGQLHGRSVEASQSSALPPSLELSRANGTLWVKFTSLRRGSFERQLPEADCAELAQAVALLADAWLREGEAGSPAAAESAPAVRAVFAGAPAAPAAEPPAEPPAAFNLRLSELAQLALGGGEVGAALRGALGLEIWNKLGLAAEVELLGQVTTADPLVRGAAIGIQRRAVALEAGYALGPQLSDGGSVWLGPELLWVEARGQRYPGNLTESVLVPGVRLGVRGNRPLNGWLFAFGGLNLALSFSTPSFGSSVAGPAVVWTLPALRMELEAGLGVRF